MDNTELAFYVKPKYIPREIIDYFPLPDELALIKDKNLAPDEILRCVQTLYALNSKNNFPVDISYSTWFSSTDAVFDKSLVGIRQTPDYMFEDVQLLNFATRLHISPDILITDFFKFPFTDLGTTKSFCECLKTEDPTHGFLDPYSLWFYATRGYLRPMEKWQYEFQTLRKRTDIKLQHVIDLLIWDFELFQPDIYPNRREIDKILKLFEKYPTFKEMTDYVGAVSDTWTHLGKDYILQEYTHEPLIDECHRGKLKALVTWKDNELTSLSDGKFLNPEHWTSRTLMISKFIEQMNIKPFPSDPRFNFLS